MTLKQLRGHPTVPKKNKIRKKKSISFSSGHYLIGSLRGMLPVIPPITGDLVVTAAKTISSLILDYILYFCLTNMIDGFYSVLFTIIGRFI